MYSERMGASFMDAVRGSLMTARLIVSLWLAARFEWFRRKFPAAGDGPEGLDVLGKNHFKFCCWALPDASSGENTEQASVRLKSTFAVRSLHTRCSCLLKSAFMLGSCVACPIVLCRQPDEMFRVRSPAHLHAAAPVRQCLQDMNRNGGYWSTSRMLLECAMCMIPQNEKLLAADPYASACPSGAQNHQVLCIDLVNPCDGGVFAVAPHDGGAGMATPCCHRTAGFETVFIAELV